MANQKFTSANTSINSKRLPALFGNSYVQDDELLEMGFVVDFADSKIIHVVRENGFYEIGSFITRKGV